jgi:hypothetical protein
MYIISKKKKNFVHLKLRLESQNTKNSNYSGPSVIWIPGWSGQFSANYNPALPTEIITTVHHHHHHHRPLGSVLALRSFTYFLW